MGSVQDSHPDNQQLYASINRDGIQKPQSTNISHFDEKTLENNTVNQLIDEYDKFDALNNLDKGETSVDSQDGVQAQKS